MKIYNIFLGKKEEFKPIKQGEIKMYVCGITPYDSSHLGHIMSAIRFNAIRNYLEYAGNKVTFVQNVTDIDDKIINKSLKTGEKPLEISEKYFKEYENVCVNFGLRKPDFQPKVSEYIPQIIKYIEDLISKDFAYATDKGNVYFDVSKKADYGKLSGRKVEELKEGTRVEGEEDKQDQIDFALWKTSDVDGASWKSPFGGFGFGRPGWHIECSVMANELLGLNIDIHGGGLDLLFPHHENELAQCEARNGVPFANYWLHSGLLNINGTKMSKSLGNFITVDVAIEKYGTELIKFAIMKFHYRSAINFTEELFRENLNALFAFYRFFKKVGDFSVGDSVSLSLNNADIEAGSLRNDFKVAMDDDFNTAEAVVVLSKWLAMAEQKYEKKNFDEAMVLAKEIKKLGGILGLFQKTYNEAVSEFLKFANAGVKQSEIEDAVKNITEARARKDYGESDKIRAELAKNGIQVMDTAQGSWWQFL